MLDATVKVLKRDGSDAITTNRVADAAGVCVGSLYQYFPDKQAIFMALHQRHIAETREVIERTLVNHAGSSLTELLYALMEALIDDHADEPELHELLAQQIPPRPDGSQGLRGALRRVIASRAQELPPTLDLERTLFIVPNMIDALAHDAVLYRPPHWAVAAAKTEATRALSVYLCP